MKKLENVDIEGIHAESRDRKKRLKLRDEINNFLQVVL